jgi:hypothetical protein
MTRQITSQGRQYPWVCDANRSSIILLVSHNQFWRINYIRSNHWGQRNTLKGPIEKKTFY